MPLDVENYAEPEVAVTAVVVAAVISPPVRRTVRRGIVYGLAGVLLVGDTVAATASALAGGVHKAVKSVKRGATATPAIAAPAVQAIPAPA
jgi:hypothetical protein